VLPPAAAVSAQPLHAGSFSNQAVLVPEEDDYDAD